LLGRSCQLGVGSDDEAGSWRNFSLTSTLEWKQNGMTDDSTQVIRKVTIIDTPVEIKGSKYTGAVNEMPLEELPVGDSAAAEVISKMIELELARLFPFGIRFPPPNPIMHKTIQHLTSPTAESVTSFLNLGNFSF
jgi:hypothetical protein